MRKTLNYLFDKNHLSYQEAKNLIIEIAHRKVSPFQIAALSSIYNMRLPTVEELKGFRQGLLEICVQVNLHQNNAIDIVGTGGDRKNTFNISTLSAFIVAGAGEKVIKHGNYSISSITGSSNILELLGYKFTNQQDTLQKQLDQAGICFLHAPLFHPALKDIIAIRKEIGTSTFFNILGPLLNPSNPQNYLLGVNHLELARLYHYFYQNVGKNYAIVYSLDGYDEISLTSSFKCYNSKGEFLYHPDDINRLKVNPKEIIGGKNNQENKRIFVNILSGKGSISQNEVVLTNAAFALSLLNKEPFEESYLRAKTSLESKQAQNILRILLNT